MKASNLTPDDRGNVAKKFRCASSQEACDERNVVVGVRAWVTSGGVLGRVGATAKPQFLPYERGS